MDSYQYFPFHSNTNIIPVFSFTFYSSFFDRINLTSINLDIFAYLISFPVCDSLSSLPPLLPLHRCFPRLIWALTACSEPTLHADAFFIPSWSCQPTRIPLPIRLGCFTPIWLPFSRDALHTRSPTPHLCISSLTLHECTFQRNH